MRALLVINRTAGTGQSALTVEKLSSLFNERLAGLSQVRVELVSSHPDARARSTEFISESVAPALIVAGGGGGTLRAVIEGICTSAELPGPERVRVGALRMGSGNLLAKQFGVPKDPVTGLRGLLTNLEASRTVSCSLTRCKTWTRSGDSEVHHVVVLGGLGQFGRTPSDLARWHARIPGIRKKAAQLFGIEKLNNAEYALAIFLRSVYGTLFSETENVEIQYQDQTERLQLLSGILMNFPISALPFKPDVGVEDEALSVYLIPRNGRLSPLVQVIAPQRLLPQTRCLRLEKGQHLEIRFVDRDEVEFFLDEDPVTTYKKLTLEVAGSIAFVPGPDYHFTPKALVQEVTR